jgi:1,4-dihydroxy-2-naphthoyl-CoA hydrolase
MMAAAMSEDFAKIVNETPGPSWIKSIGLTITQASADEVRGEWEVGPQHHQGFGIVHGGVHSSVIETMASIGAHLVASARGQRVVGLENHTSFIRGVERGRLRAIAKPVTRGRTTQVWECEILDEEDKLVARGSVRLLSIA